MWSNIRALRDALAALKAENTDLRAQVRFLTQSAHDRETKLIDRILALSNPAAHREIHPLPDKPRMPMGDGEPRRVHFPGVGMTPPPAPGKAAQVLIQEPTEEEEVKDAS